MPVAGFFVIVWPRCPYTQTMHKESTGGDGGNELRSGVEIVGSHDMVP